MWEYCSVTLSPTLPIWSMSGSANKEKTSPAAANMMHQTVCQNWRWPARTVEGGFSVPRNGVHRLLRVNVGHHTAPRCLDVRCGAPQIGNISDPVHAFVTRIAVLDAENHVPACLLRAFVEALAELDPACVDGRPFRASAVVVWAHTSSDRATEVMRKMTDGAMLLCCTRQH